MPDQVDDDTTAAADRVRLRPFLNGPMVFWECPRCVCSFSQPMTFERASAEAAEHEAWHKVCAS